LSQVPPASERRLALHEALVRAAETTVAEDGLPGLRARDLAAEVGCALGAIYNVFPNLDALILEVNRRTLAELETFIAADSGGLPPGAAMAGHGRHILARLASRYLAFAEQNPLRWRAVFEHRLPAGLSVPDWYLTEQARLFGYVEMALRDIQPDLGEAESALLARTVFSAVHGIVSLGLDEKLGAVPIVTLQDQLEAMLKAFSDGLATRAPARAKHGAHPQVALS
jgi:AcrR family transcriptional regulator